MLKSIFVLLFSSIILFGSDIKWEKDIVAAVERANQEHKPLMVVVTKQGCRWCEVLKDNTLKDPKVISAVNQGFVAYEGVVDEGTVPNSLMTSGTPATWFIKGKTPMFEPIMGAVDSENFLKALDIVTKEYIKSVPKK